MVKQRRRYAGEQESVIEFKYKATPTLAAFHKSNASVRGVKGPIGSGKSVGCVAEAYTRCLRQAPDRDGVRRSRWGFVRNTYPELISTTMNTWKDWVPESICPISLSSPISGLLELNLPDGTRVEAEIYFLALEYEEDVKKLQSFEFTGIWLNEASNIRHKAILDMAVGRIDRYPSTKGGNPGPSWTGVIMDTNAMDDTHWWYQLAEVIQPEDYEFFNQPPAVLERPRKPNADPDAPPEYLVNTGQYFDKQGIPAAENLSSYIRDKDPTASNYDPEGVNYYKRQLAGKTRDWIEIYLKGNYGSLFTGKPVYPEYRDNTHFSSDDVEVHRALPLVLGWDFGLTPACVICQQTLTGQLRVLDELYEEDMGIGRFCRDIVQPFLTKNYAGMKIFNVADPAGNQRAQTDERTMFQIMRDSGFVVESAPSNKFERRREGVAFFLNKMVDGKPGFLLGPRCEILRKGFRGGYHYRKMQVKNTDRYTLEPEKDAFSHPHDALQYVALYLSNASLANNTDSQFAGKARARKIKPRNPSPWS